MKVASGEKDRHSCNTQHLPAESPWRCSRHRGNARELAKGSGTSWRDGFDRRSRRRPPCHYCHSLSSADCIAGRLSTTDARRWTLHPECNIAAARFVRKFIIRKSTRHPLAATGSAWASKTRFRLAGNTDRFPERRRLVRQKRGPNSFGGCC